MDIVEFREYCLSLPDVEETLPFDDSTLVYKVGGRMFAMLMLEKPDHFVVKCDMQNDSCGQPIQTERTTGESGEALETISGWFFFNSTPSVLISPTGGYRISDSVEYTYKHINNTGSKTGTIDFANTSVVKFMHYYYDLENLTQKYEEVNFKELSLTDVSYLCFDFNAFMREKELNSGLAKGFTKININLDMTFVVLTYFEVTSYVQQVGSDEKVYNDVILYKESVAVNGSGDIVLDATTQKPTYKLDEILLMTNGIDANSNLNLVTSYGTTAINGLDSAHNKIVAKIESGNLIIYGYFDYDVYNNQVHVYDGGTYKYSYTNKALVSVIIQREDYPTSDAGNQYSWWFANGTQETIGDSTHPSSSEVRSIYEDVTEIEPLEFNTKSIVYFYNTGDSSDSDTNKNAQLDPKNHMIYLLASKTAVKYLTVWEQFFYIDESGNLVEEYTGSNVNNKPIIPINFAYNVEFNSTDEQGTFVYNNMSDVIIDEAKEKEKGKEKKKLDTLHLILDYLFFIFYFFINSLYLFLDKILGAHYLGPRSRVQVIKGI